MDTESLKAKLKQEGFKHVYEWEDKPGTTYPAHSHKGKVSMYITDGSITLDIEGKKVELKSGDRFDVPVGKEHSAIVGPDGCSYIVGEMMKGDS